MKRLLIGMLVLMAVGAYAANDAYLHRFEQAWRLVKDYYYDLDYRGVNWNEVGERYRRLVAAASSWKEVYELLDDMYAELGDDHSRIISPPEAQQALRGALCYSLPFPVPEEDTSEEEAEWQKEVASEESSDYEWDSFKYNLKDNIGYLRLPNLIDEAIAEDVKKAVKDFDKQGVKGYILDLRGNPGGLALTMAEVAGVFMRGLPWRIVTRTKGVMPQPTIPFWGKPLTEKPLIVLIDKGVNSAAEGLAGALKQAGRATLIGERTAGNTEVIIPYCFPDGGVAMLASGVLAPFNGPTWEGRGVEPDIKINNEKTQLKKALELIKKY